MEVPKNLLVRTFNRYYGGMLEAIYKPQVQRADLPLVLTALTVLGMTLAIASFLPLPSTASRIGSVLGLTLAR